MESSELEGSVLPSLLSSVPDECGASLRAAAVSGLLSEVGILLTTATNLVLASNRLIYAVGNQLPSDANKIRSRYRRWVVILRLSALAGCSYHTVELWRFECRTARN